MTAADEQFMREALAVARTAADRGDVPVGAVVVRDGRIVSAAANRTVADQDPTAHAEVLALRLAAAAASTWKLRGHTVYVTLEPCAMCAGALVLARVDRVVFGAWDEKAGMGGSIGDILRHRALNHRPGVTAGILAADCADLLADFFRVRRALRSPGGSDDAGAAATRR